MNDTPIAYTAEGRPLFDNTPTVVCVVALVGHRFVAVERARDPGKGKLGLPGGYHMAGETWQQAGCRELFEETGLVLDPDFLKLESLDTDEYGNNLIIARALAEPTRDPNFVPDPEEVLSIRLMTSVGTADRWAFPRHYNAVRAIVPPMFVEAA